jgi:hypothetical protein
MGAGGRINYGIGFRKDVGDAERRTDWRCVGQRVEMQLQVSGADGDHVVLYYKLSDATQWAELPLLNAPNMWTASVFTNTDPESKQDLQVLAFDGHDHSNAVVLEDVDNIRQSRTLNLKIEFHPLYLELPPVQAAPAADDEAVPPTAPANPPPAPELPRDRGDHPVRESKEPLPPSRRVRWPICGIGVTNSGPSGDNGGLQFGGHRRPRSHFVQD